MAEQIQRGKKKKKGCLFSVIALLPAEKIEANVSSNIRFIIYLHTISQMYLAVKLFKIYQPGNTFKGKLLVFHKLINR